MKRIGLVASKISKGNRALYNVYVVCISLLLSFFMFVFVGAIVIFSLAIIKYVGSEIMGVEFEQNWTSILSICMVSLTVVVSIFSLVGIMMNLKTSRLTD